MSMTKQGHSCRIPCKNIILISDTMNKGGRNIPQNELNKQNVSLLKCVDGILIDFGWSANPDLSLLSTRKEAVKACAKEEPVRSAE